MYMLNRPPDINQVVSLFAVWPSGLPAGNAFRTAYYAQKWK